MAYSVRIVEKARQALENAKADKESQYLQNLQRAYIQVPRLKEIDSLLRRSMAAAAQAAFAKGSDAREMMEQVKKANLSLQQERETLLKEKFPACFLDESPVCDTCGGAGYVGSKMCDCLHKLCQQEQAKELQQLTSGQESFANFRLDYYPDQPDPNIGVSPRKIMEANLKVCKTYAAGFTPDIGNLMFVGGTGLGKTFLSACIANAVVDKGFSVAYESAPRLFSKLEKERFNPDEASHADAENFRTCDLLIIDDLGTEMPGQFVTAALYNLLTERLTEHRAILVSTNLNADEMARRYSPQIASRLQGNFRRLTFVGQDIRVLQSK